MMKVLILGANGMLGHKVYQACQERFDTWAATRRIGYTMFDLSRVVDATIDYWDVAACEDAIEKAEPDAIVNCAGIVRQRMAEAEPTAIFLNSIFPHALAAWCVECGIRLIHVSTDCVFSGRNGSYTEDDEPDPMDTYGWSKLLGEVSAPGCLTLRTSFIGRELETQRGLAEWLISNQGGQVQGWTRAAFSGPTTQCLASVIADVIENHPSLHGVYHVSGDPISKFDLLHLFNESFDLGVDITPDDSMVCNRVLGSARFRAATNWGPPSWPDMIEDMRSDPTPYDEWRQSCLPENE